MSANSSKLFNAAIFTTVALVAFSLLFALQLNIPLSFAANQIAPNVIISVNVPMVCEISLNTQTISFGIITPSQNTITTTQNVLDTNNGNGGTYAWVYGGNWIGGASSFDVINTAWSSSSATGYGPATKLTTISANTAIAVGSASSASVWFGLGIPAGQAANTYSQNIIITNVC